MWVQAKKPVRSTLLLMTTKKRAISCSLAYGIRSQSGCAPYTFHFFTQTHIFHTYTCSHTHTYTHTRTHRWRGQLKLASCLWGGASYLCDGNPYVQVRAYAHPHGRPCALAKNKVCVMQLLFLTPNSNTNCHCGFVLCQFSWRFKLLHNDVSIFAYVPCEEDVPHFVSD